MLIALIGWTNFLFSENMQKIPRTISLTSTPALAAVYNLSISSSSESEFIFKQMEAGFLALAFLISLLISLFISLRKLVGQGISVVHVFNICIPSFQFSK